MELRQLKYFVSAAKHLNFTKAASECYIVQTAMTHQIASLEEELGVKLFIRGNRSLALTEAGQVFLKEARMLITGVEKAAEEVRLTAGEYESILRLGICGKLLSRDMPKLLRQFRMEHPRVRVRVVQESLEELLELLEIGSLDCVLALDYDYFRTFPWIEREVIFTDDLMLAVPLDHWLADREEVSLDELKNEKFFVFYEKGVNEKTISCAKEGVLLNIEEEVRSPEIAALMVEAGYGVGFCMSCTGDGRTEYVKRIRVISENNKNEIVLLRRKGEKRPVLQQWQDILNQFPFEARKEDAKK